MRNKLDEIKDSINRSLVSITYQSIDKSLYEDANKKRLESFINLLKKGIPAHRILNKLSKEEGRIRELSVLASSFVLLNKKQKIKASKVLAYINMLDNTIEYFERFLRILKMRIFIMNIMLSITYSILPWLSSVGHLKFSYLLETMNFSIMPNMLTVIFYAIFLSINSLLILTIFFDIKSIKTHFITSLLIYAVMQIIIYFVLTRNVLSLYII
jgi:hypothetical protein